MISTRDQKVDLLLLHAKHFGGEILLAALVGNFHHALEAEFLHCALIAELVVRAEIVVLIDQAEAGILLAELFHRILHTGMDRIAVVGADDEDVLLHRIICLLGRIDRNERQHLLLDEHRQHGIQMAGS